MAVQRDGSSFAKFLFRNRMPSVFCLNVFTPKIGPPASANYWNDNGKMNVPNAREISSHKFHKSGD
jgi:hypothetical protein